MKATGQTINHLRLASLSLCIRPGLSLSPSPAIFALARSPVSFIPPLHPSASQSSSSRPNELHTSPFSLKTFFFWPHALLWLSFTAQGLATCAQCHQFIPLHGQYFERTFRAAVTRARAHTHAHVQRFPSSFAATPLISCNCGTCHLGKRDWCYC